MASNRKKIYLMICSEVPDLKREDWLEQMPELNILADIEPVFVFSQPSADITPEIWIKLATEIYQRMDRADGFVVFHGLDNLLFTSSALSFLVQKLSKPVIFTGGQLEPGDTKRLDLKANLINACQAANFDVPEVGLMFGNRLVRANQSTRTVDESLNIFSTPSSGILGKIDFSIRMYDKVILKNSGKPKLYNALNTNIEVIAVEPILNFKHLTKRVEGRDGVVIRADRYQNLPQDLLFLIQKVTHDIPVVVWSDRITATTLAPKNIIVVNNMTWPSTITKFMWALTQSDEVAAIKELMSRDIAGEIITIL